MLEGQHRSYIKNESKQRSLMITWLLKFEISTSLQEKFRITFINYKHSNQISITFLSQVKKMFYRTRNCQLQVIYLILVSLLKSFTSSCEETKRNKQSSYPKSNCSSVLWTEILYKIKLIWSQYYHSSSRIGKVWIDIAYLYKKYSFYFQSIFFNYYLFVECFVSWNKQIFKKWLQCLTFILTDSSMYNDGLGVVLKTIRHHN